MHTEAVLPALDDETVHRVARQALGAVAKVLTWECRPLNFRPLNSVTGGLYRVTGTARADSKTVPWSAILKVMQASDWGPDDPAHWNYWRREAFAYQSGLTAQLPDGLAAPRLYEAGAVPGEAQKLWLWVEEIRDESPERWPVSRFEQAARLLGRWAGLRAGRPLPDHPWLCRRYLRACFRLLDPSREQLLAPETWADPSVRRAFPPQIAERAQQLLQDGHLLLDAVEGLPQVLCHGDASRFNMMFLAREMVLIDWSFLGLGAVGEDLGHQLTAMLATRHVDPDEAGGFFEAVLAAYLDGLRSAGWSGDPREVRFAYAASTALRSAGFLPWMLKRQADGAEPLDRNETALIGFVLDLADEAFRLRRDVQRGT